MEIIPNTVPTMKLAAQHLGLTISVLKRAKKLGAEGINTNNSVNIEKFRIWYEANKIAVGKDEKDSIESLKKENLQEDIKIKKLKVKELERNLVSPEEIKEYLVGLSTKISITINSELKELPPRISGKSEPECLIIINKVIENIFKVLKETPEFINKK